MYSMDEATAWYDVIFIESTNYRTEAELEYAARSGGKKKQD